MAQKKSDIDSEACSVAFSLMILARQSSMTMSERGMKKGAAQPTRCVPSPNTNQLVVPCHVMKRRVQESANKIRKRRGGRGHPQARRKGIIA